MGSLAEFRSIIGPSESRYSKRSWSSVEERLGLDLPSDYKEWGTEYCTLSIGDRILVENYACVEGDVRRWVIDAMAPFVDSMSVSGVYNTYDEMGSVVASDESIWPVYPENPGLLRWGTISGGFDLMWMTQGPPADWRVVVSDDAGDLHLSTYRFLDFLIAAMSREITHIFNPIQALAAKEFHGYKDIEISGRGLRVYDLRPMSL